MEPQTQKRALLVDDEPLARMVARKGLEGAGCYVSEAESCAQAEAQWRSQVFDLVVLDHRLDDGLGMDVLARMRAEGRQEPVIYLSAEAQEEMTEDRRRDLRVHAVLAKPLNLEALALAVASAGGSPEPAALAPQALRHGRFVVVQGPAEWTVPAAEALRKAQGGPAWLALDMGAVRSIEDGVLVRLLDWASDCQRRGGRFCLANLSDEWMHYFMRNGADRQMDCVGDLAALDALSRRLSSTCERRSLLDSVVRSAI